MRKVLPRAKTGAKNRRMRQRRAISGKNQPRCAGPQWTFAQAGLALFLFAARPYYADKGHSRQLYFSGAQLACWTMRHNARGHKLIRRLRQNAARDQLIFRRVGPALDHTLGVGRAEARKRIQLRGRRRVDVEEIACGLRLCNGLRMLTREHRPHTHWADDTDTD